MSKFIFSLAASLGLMLAAFAVSASPITITSSYIGAYSYDGAAGDDNDVDTSVAFGARSLLAVDGGNSSSTNINWVDTGSGALLDYDMSHVRTGAYLSYSQSFQSTLTFTANVDTTYAISGQYDVDDVTTAGRALSYVYLQNLTTGSGYEFRDFEISDYTVDESFTMGVAGEGDTNSIFEGSQSGILIAGNEYKFYFSNLTQAFPSADGGASATGCVTLSIGGATGGCGSSSVPEPMPLALLGAGLAVLGLRRRRNCQGGTRTKKEKA